MSGTHTHTHTYTHIYINQGKILGFKWNSDSDTKEIENNHDTDSLTIIQTRIDLNRQLSKKKN